MTIPATQDGDHVVAWKDMITPSGISVSVSDSNGVNAYSMLTFVNGKPTLLSPLLSFSSQVWFPSKRGSIYSAKFRDLTAQDADIFDTNGAGAPQPVIFYSELIAFNAPNFIYFIYDGGFGTGPQGDFGWEIRAMVRSDDTTWQMWRQNSQEATLAAQNVQASTSAGASRLYGNVVAFLFNPSGVHISQAETYLAGISPLNPAWTTFIKCAGDSITAGLGSTGLGSYPAQLQSSYAPSVVGVRDFGVPSATIANMATNSYFIDLNWPTSATRKIVNVWCGTNDLFFGATSADTYSAYVAYCQARQTAGWKVISFTILPRTGAPAGFETSRLAVNALISSNNATFSDAFADVASIPQLSDPTNTTYYADGTHLTNAGYALVAALVKTQVDLIP